MWLCFLSVSCLAWGDPALGSMGFMVGLVVTFKRTYTKGLLPGLLLPVPVSLLQAVADTCLHVRLPNTSRKVLFSLLWGHCSFPLGLGALKILFVPSKGGVCFPQSWVSLVVKPYQPIKSDSLGTPSSFVGSPAWEDWCGSQNLHNSGRTFLVLFSSLWVAHPAGIGFYFVMIAPLLRSCYSFLFVFRHGVPFSGGFHCPPVHGCSTASWNFGVLTGGDECTSSSPPSSTSNIYSWLFKEPLCCSP